MIHIHSEAQQAAQKAVDAALEKYGRDHKVWLFCGFGWALIKPARGKFVNTLKANRIGHRGTYGGWEISAYDMFNVDGPISQSMELKEIGVRAYCDVLQSHGINAYPQSRAD